VKREVRFIAIVIVGVALATAVVWLVLRHVTSQWFERDLALRAKLGVGAARPALVERWDPRAPGELASILSEMTLDERVMGAAACDEQHGLVARTAEFPAALGCGAVPDAASRGAVVSSLPGGEVFVSAVDLADDDGKKLGRVIIVQDLSFIARREATFLNLLLAGFALLAAAAVLVTIVGARLAWRGFADDLERVLRGEGEAGKFHPLLADVRALVSRLVSEREGEVETNGWSPARLKHTLAEALHGERVVVLANREPYIHERDAAGDLLIKHPASGLVTALEPVLRACSGVWVAHGSGSADRETVDARSRLRVPPGEESYMLRRVWLTPEQEQGYYYGIANEGLWPLCHTAHTRPVFTSEAFRHYRDVNRAFARAVLDEVDSDDPIVFVQDYHFALASRMIRERLPRATILMFWHIPWPNAERFGICPYRDEILDGMLGASIVGFHTQHDCNNFVDSVERYLEARTDREHHAVIRNERRTLVRPYPISIEWPVRWLADAPPVAVCRARVFEELGLPKDALLGVGVDRLDYTKGIEERLLAVERLLERRTDLRGRFTFAQLAAPSRTVIERYRELDASVRRLAERINVRFGSGSYRPIVLLSSHHEPPEVFRFYRAADVCYVSSLHDGMNLVAKEFVAARDDERGALVLSQFTGAARELTEALVVNPYDLDEASAALGAALDMTPHEQRERMRAMRSFVSEFNVYRWAGRMLADAARLRNRDRLSFRLGFRPAQDTRARGPRLVLLSESERR